jgi:hypothetical protein
LKSENGVSHPKETAFRLTSFKSKSKIQSCVPLLINTNKSPPKLSHLFSFFLLCGPFLCGLQHSVSGLSLSLSLSLSLRFVYLVAGGFLALVGHFRFGFSSFSFEKYFENFV